MDSATPHSLPQFIVIREMAKNKKEEKNEGKDNMVALSSAQLSILFVSSR